ncbi:lantibiotic dehydratase [Kribbella sp. DT2]|uniref:lantibiotic dehydratase n=1 Tax=Kribbella sp. DT2 TaxID=3393427 RepID=UPI003CF42D94
MTENTSGPALFRAGHFAVLRLSEATPARTASAPDASPAWSAEPAIDPANATVEQLRAHLHELIADPVLREAIEVSSGSLGQGLDRIDQLDRVKLERTLLATARYRLRMGGRPTPFGLLAGVSVAEVGEVAKVVVGDRPVKAVRPDAGWMHALVRELLRDPLVRARSEVVVNNLCEVRGDRLVLPYLRRLAGVESGRSLSIAHGPAVQSALVAARRPIAYSELHALVLNEFPEGTAEHVHTLLGQLLEREILLTDVSTFDDLDELANRLEGLDVATPVRRVASLLTQYAEALPGEGIAIWRDLTAAMADLATADAATNGRPPVQVDLRADAETVLPRAVLDEAASAGDVLWRLAPQGEAFTNLKAFHQEFLERYGVDQLVGVRELLDPHLGLGAPSEYQQPPTERNTIPAPGNPYPAARDELLGDLLGTGDELVLDADLVQQLAGEANDDVPPDSLDLCLQLLAESADAVSRGEFTLLAGAGAGAVSAGAMLGRFAGLLNAEERLAGLQQTGADGPFPVQLEFLPADPRFGNVLRVPRLLPDVLAVGTFAGEDALGIDDVVVGSSGERLFLLAPGLDRELQVVRPHMINMATAAPNAARFVAALSLAGRRMWTPWRWGRLDALARLPRVRSGHTILAPARWRAPSALADVTLTADAWAGELARWRDRHDVPDLVRISLADHHLDLDLREPLHRRLLRDQFKRSRVVTETPAIHGSFGVTADRANELVVPLLSNRPRPAIRSSRSWSRPPRRHHPGGEWVFAKVYALPDTHDSLLVRHVSRLTQELSGRVDRWFFLRYKDPEAHLRLRFHGPAAEILPVLHDWTTAAVEAGAIRSIVLDGYDPEVARYGGEQAMPVAERLFQADSASVIGQLGLRATRKLDLPIETLVAANCADLLASLGEWDWRRWVLNAFPIEVSNDVPAAVRTAAMPLLDLDGDALPDDLRALWTERRAVGREYGDLIGIGTDDQQHQAIGAVLHLQANRLLGTDRTAEQRAYGLLRAAVRRQVGAQEHRR